MLFSMISWKNEEYVDLVSYIHWIVQFEFKRKFMKDYIMQILIRIEMRLELRNLITRHAFACDQIDYSNLFLIL